MVSSPKSETSSALQAAIVARAFSSMRKRSSPCSSNAVAVPERDVLGIRGSYLQRQGDRALLVGAQDAGRKAGGKAARGARGDELGGGGDRRPFEVGRQAAPAARRQQDVGARAAVDQDRALWSAQQDRLAVAHVEHAYLWRGVGPRREGGRRDQAGGDDRGSDGGLASRARQVRAGDRRAERRVVGGPEPAREG